jgi:UMF1 family MFS transporter
MNLRAALQPGVSRRELLAWALYDVANSGYTTVVLTAVFSAYFVSAIAGNAPWASFAWTATLAVSSLLVMLTMPALGAWADLRARRGVLLRLSTVGCVLATAMMSLLGPGMLAAAIVLVILSSYCYTVGESTIAAYLPELARREALGRVSGWGWGLGYVGGMFTLGLSLAWVLSAPSRGQTAGEAVPFTMLITAAVFAAASLPPLLLLRESGSLVDLRRLLLLGAVYQAGIAVVIALAAVYAQQQMGFTEVQTMTLIFAVNVAAAGGALSFGHFQDRVGHRRSLGLTLLGWVVVCLLAGLASSVTMFWLAATLAGLCMGSSQSAGRAMLGALAPPARLTEFYGLWAFAGRVAAIVGPLTYGGVTWASGGDHRLAILSTGLFFVIALILLRDIDIERGALAARATDQPAR